MSLYCFTIKDQFSCFFCFASILKNKDYRKEERITNKSFIIHYTTF